MWLKLGSCRMVITHYIYVLKRKPIFDLELLNLTNQVSIGVMMIKGSKIPGIAEPGRILNGSLGVHTAL